MTAVLRRTNNLGMTRWQERRVAKELRQQTSKALAERDRVIEAEKHVQWWRR